MDNGRLDYPGFQYTGLEGNYVLSTADIPSQAVAANVPTLRILLPLVFEKKIGTSLPPELVEYILALSNLGISREQAEKTRRRLMEDRKVKSQKENEVGLDLFGMAWN